MADNIKVNEGDQYKGVSVATDEIDNEHHPKYKIEYGADGEATQVDSDNPLPTESVLLTSRTVQLLDINRDILEVNKDILNQLKLMNSHFAEWDGEEK